MVSDVRPNAKPGFIGGARLAPVLAMGLAMSGSAWADPATDTSEPPQTLGIHFQSTLVDQGHDAFTSPYDGTNSLYPKASGRETFDLTLIAGVRPWRGLRSGSIRKSTRVLV